VLAIVVTEGRLDSLRRLIRCGIHSVLYREILLSDFLWKVSPVALALVGGLLGHHVRHKQCLVVDERVSELHEAGELDELREYLEAEYNTAYEALVATLMDDHPSFWNEEDDAFTGPESTNAIEGGNWRLKYGLGGPL
jgi:hypothetical protein